MMEQQENTRRHILRVEDWECCKDKVFVEAVGIEMNKDLIQRIPHRIFGGDIACIYRIDLISQKSIRVMNEMLELWGITEDELNRTALGNTMKKYPAVMMPVGAALKELTQEKIDKEVEDSPLVIITNKASSSIDIAYGASVIFYPGVQDKIIEHMKGEDVYLIPSSVQEWLLCPKYICQEPGIEEFIKYMNKQMPKGLRLSDHLHTLDPVNRELTCPNYQPDLQ